MNIYEEMKNAGQEVGAWQSDLYVKITPISREIVSRYAFKRNVTTFICEIDRLPWYDIPFTYMPFWERRKP